MELKRGQVVKVTGVDYDIEIVGMNPTGQPFQVNWSDNRVFRVKIDGKETPMKEDFLRALIASGKNVEVVAPEAPAKPEITDNSEEKIPLLKKRLGRPPKVI